LLINSHYINNQLLEKTKFKLTFWIIRAKSDEAVTTPHVVDNKKIVPRIE